MLNLMGLGVLGVFFGVGDLLKLDNAPIGTMAAEYTTLTERSGQMNAALIETDDH